MNCVVRRKQRTRRIRGALLFFIALLIMSIGYWYLQISLPDRLYVDSLSDTEQIVLPFSGIVHTASSMGKSNIPEDAVHIDCSLFGILPLKTVEISEQPAAAVIPCGNITGIFLETDGVMVVGAGTISGIDGVSCEPAKNIVKSGDYITEVNGNAITKKEELVDVVNCCSGKNVTLTVDRNGEKTELMIHPIQTAKEEYKLGIWVRDDTQGIGTITCMDAEGNYVALGHGICDLDTGLLMKIRSGILYGASVQSVKKGIVGTPGELAGTIKYQDSEILGTITKNSDTGLYGVLQNRTVLASMQKEARTYMKTAYKQEVHEGYATILCCIDGSVKEYEVEIQKLNLGHLDVNKGIVLEVTDPELLEKTGGIIQGMSGSPIIQDGKLAGAVTHVFVNDPTKGYGIFAETMLSAGSFQH